MNIFALHQHPVVAAKQHFDNHVVKMLEQYKAGETRGAQSALMWGQAANLSTQDMEDLQAYIDGFDI